MSGKLQVRWRPRDEPLAPAAVVGQGEASRALARRLLALAEGTLSKFRGVAAPGLLVALGAPEDLPWVEDAAYLGREPRAPSLLLPTSRAPDVAAELFERAARLRAGTAAAPIAVLLDPPALVSVAAARPIDRASLAAWLEEQG